MNDRILHAAQDDREREKKGIRLCDECAGMLRDAGYNLAPEGKTQMDGCECCEQRGPVRVYQIVKPKRRRRPWTR